MSDIVDRYTCKEFRQGLEKRMDNQEDKIDEARAWQMKVSEAIVELKTLNKTLGKKKWYENKWFDRAMLVGLFLVVAIVLTAIGKEVLISEILSILGGV